jgi:hypothetical protein
MELDPQREQPRLIGGEKVKIYVASSWRNQLQPAVVTTLRKEGHQVYDFRHPKEGDNGFHWSEIDPAWQKWTPTNFISALNHPIAHSGFQSDFSAMNWADACVLVLPCGRSAHLEAGWFVGRGKRLVILIDDPNFEPELMYKMAFAVCTTCEETLRYLRS